MTVVLAVYIVLCMSPHSSFKLPSPHVLLLTASTTAGAFS